MDVVPVYRVFMCKFKYFKEKWTFDPFGAEMDNDGNIYARGSQDSEQIQPSSLDSPFCKSFFSAIDELLQANPGALLQKILEITNNYCVNTKLTDYIEAFNLISDNQLGARRQCQGAKEQALINQCVNSEYGNNLFATWIDVRKAFDSVNHEFLCQVLDQSGIPNWITNFVKTLIKNWNVILTLNNKRIGTVKLERGILQGDSLSPQLFTLVMDPLSRSLNMKFPKVRIGQNDPFTVSYSTNHLLFIDDLKIIAEKEDTVLKMMEDVDEYFDAVGLKGTRKSLRLTWTM
ncbi:uncharacterized protein LOC115229489 [Octopus sinensis]|uniref:Uncharacterized protein LOC115229489 n=1 Tax=Octopus sinensis TaxID=2607531 RepID=A0A6P7U2F3_9MOLL|nr:uncharacterized protein LOC115229489 [Octopus sinensis]